MSDNESATPSGRQLLLVVGQGRSGTSLFTGIMHELGLHVPQPEIVADHTNPKGFGEPKWVVEFHQRLLRRLGVHPSDARPDRWAMTGQTATRGRVRAELRTWLDEQLVDNSHLIVKDPRTAWFLGLWREVARDLDLPIAIVTMLRHPAEVVQSKQTAYGGRLAATARMAGWVNGMLFTERATRDFPRSFVRYQALLEDWTQETSRSDTQLGMGLVASVSVGKIRAASKLVDPDLRRSASAIDDLGLPDQLGQLALDTWEQLSALVDSPTVADREPRAAALDELRGQYVDYYADCEGVATSSILAAEASARRAKPDAAKAGTASEATQSPPAERAAGLLGPARAPSLRRRMLRRRSNR